MVEGFERWSEEDVEELECSYDSLILGTFTCSFDTRFRSEFCVRCRRENKKESSH